MAMIFRMDSVFKLTTGGGSGVPPVASPALLKHYAEFKNESEALLNECANQEHMVDSVWALVGVGTEMARMRCV